MKKSVLRKYAQLIARMGVNIQKGQEVVINADLDQPEFVKILVEECYKAGASAVKVKWDYQPLTKTTMKYCSVKTLTTIPEYEIARYEHYVKVLPCMIYLESQDPDGLKGINQDKMQKVERKNFPVLKKYFDQMENKYQWCVAAVPGPKWAKRLFPELSVKQAQEKLWEKILTASRVTEDPIASWEQHNKNLLDRCDRLNSLGISSLHYTSKNGTDFTVGLIKEGVFRGGPDYTRSGIFFDSNIPTEECFISPKKGVAEGIVYATLPLSFDGELIENFWIRFHEGKAVEWHAEKNNELLTHMLNADENSAYLGECALVPFESPIRQTGILFYNTLFDENAACHLALGMGFKDTIKDFEKKTPEECRALGVNDSIIHVDFMIGSDDLNIDATTFDGKVIPIFKNGTWAF